MGSQSTMLMSLINHLGIILSHSVSHRYSHFSPSHHVQYTSPLPSLLGKTSTHHQAASSRTLSSPSLSEDLAAAAGGEYTYGPGASNIRPWTRRVDQGINSRVDNKQGGEIYYIGIIDILQQYNNHKKAETFFKVRLFSCSSSVMTDGYVISVYSLLVEVVVKLFNP